MWIENIPDDVGAYTSRVPSTSSPRGRPRDADLDQAILQAAQRQLAQSGYDAMSVVAIADEAGTTRQAVYRRWPTKADLATAAIAALSEAAARPVTESPFDDLVAELAAFRRGVGRPNGIGMVGVMMHEAVDAELRRLYRQRVVVPRRDRLRAILLRGVDAGLLRDDLDVDHAVAACTGTYYAQTLAGARIARDWPRRTAAMVWRSLGGEPPG